MKQLLVYLAQMIIASGILYGYYHFFLRNKKFHRYNRYYLLMAVVISIIIPFMNIPVYFSQQETDNSVLLQTLSVISSPVGEEETVATAISSQATASYNWFSWQNIFYATYLLLAVLFIMRILFSVRRIRIISKNYPAEKIGDINFVNTAEPGTPFSFFNWMFWNREIELDSDKGQQIFRHELFHIEQKHSSDIVFIEMIAALGWFNPFFHLIKKELKAIHEFLADEFAMQRTESWKYAELLLMQALNTKQHLVNPFFHTQIKRRIAMITTSQKPGHRYLRKLLVLPVAAVIAALFAFSYKNRKAENDSALKANEPITIVVDAAHGGTDDGAKSLDGKTTEAELALEIAKQVKQLAPEYNINVVMTREDENFPGGVNDVRDALRKRVAISNQINPSAYVSVHINAAGKPASPTRFTGFDAYITARRENTKDRVLASAILNEVSSFYHAETIIKTRSNHGLFVLDSNIAPSVILECGYITNLKDFEFITNKENQEKIARAILNGVSKFANQSKLQKDFKTLLQENIKQAIDTPKKKYPDTLSWIKSNTKPARQSPTSEQLKTWQDPKIYGVWIDAKKVLNTELVKYKPKDFDWFNVSKLYGAAKKNKTYEYQVSLYTPKYFNESFKTFSPPVFKDTSMKMVVLDGKYIRHMRVSEVEKTFKADEIESIHILKDKAAKDKYGEKAGWGVIEIHTKKQTPPALNEVVLTTTNKVSDPEPVFEKLEIQPSFPGGHQAWVSYLRRNLRAGVAVKNGAKPGTYTALVKFIVDKDGGLESIKALTKHGFGMEEEVIRVISKGPKWNPGSQNGRIVRAYHTQPVTFVVIEEPNEKAPTDTPVNTKGKVPTLDFPGISLKKLQAATAHDLIKPDTGAEILSFLLTAENSDGTTSEAINSGNDLNLKIKELFATMTAGKIILIEGIVVVQNGEKKKLPSKVYKITD